MRRSRDHKVIDMPISEAAFTGLGIGLAIKGKKVFIEFNFAGLVYLALDQIFNQAHKYNEMLNTNIDLDLTYIFMLKYSYLFIVNSKLKVTKYSR